MKIWQRIIWLVIISISCFGWNAVFPFLSEVKDLDKTFDGNYIACGSYLDFYGYYPAQIMKFTDSSDTLWTSIFRFPTSNIRLSAITERDDSSFVAVGYTDNNRFGDWDIVIFWIDKNGEFLRNTIIPVPCDDDYPTEVLVLENNKLIISSWTDAANPERSGRFIVKTDSLGNVLWRQKYGVLYCRDIIEADEGFIFCGGNKVIKINDSGDIIWSISNSFENYNLEADHEGTGFVVCGCNSADMVLAHYDFDSTHIYTRYYGGSEGEYALTVSRGPDSTYYIAGATESFASYGMFCTNVYVVKVNNVGDTLWTSFTGGDSYDYIICSTVNDDGSIVCGGMTMSWDHFDEAGYVVRLDNEGEHGSVSYLTYNLTPGWNLLSLPLSNEYAISEFSRFSESAFKYNSVTREYYAIDTISTGDCFWLLCMNNERAVIGGEEWVWHTMDTLYPGWNLIYSPRNLYEVDLLHIYYPCIISPAYEYDVETRNYNEVDYMHLGKSYWVLSTDTVFFEIP